MSAVPWIQVYDPLGGVWLSTAAAALPIVLLLAALGVLEWRAHRAALLGLVAALAVSVMVFGMPIGAAAATAAYGAAYGFLPIGWIVLNAVFLYSLTVETGQFEILRSSVGRLSGDRRIQALLVAFSFGAFIEGPRGSARRSRSARRCSSARLHAALRRGSLIANTAPAPSARRDADSHSPLPPASRRDDRDDGGPATPFVSLTPAWLWSR